MAIVPGEYREEAVRVMVLVPGFAALSSVNKASRGESRDMTKSHAILMIGVEPGNESK